MSDGMGREPAYLSSHATNRYFIPNWGMFYLKNDRHLILLHRIVPFCKIDSKEGHDETSGTFQVLDNNVLMLVCP